MIYDHNLLTPLIFVSVDTEIPILPQSPSPPPQQPAQQHRSTTQQQVQNAQQQHRPLLHGLLSGTHIPQAPYHRGYSSSSTGQFHKPNYDIIPFQLTGNQKIKWNKRRNFPKNPRTLCRLIFFVSVIHSSFFNLNK